MSSFFVRTIWGCAIVGILSVVAAATESSAAVYYVDQQSPVASDSNSGTRDRPFQTLWKASRTVQPGDKVIVKAGRYNERLNFYNGNLRNSTRQTVFKAQGEVWFYGADTLYAPNLVIRDFRVTMPSSVIASDWTARYAFFVRSHNVKILHNYVVDFPGVGVHGYWVQPWSKNVVVRNNTFRRVNQGIVVQGDNWLVQNNEVDRLIDHGLDCDYMRFFGRNIVIRWNFLHGARLSDIGNSHVDGFQWFPNNGWYADNVHIVGNYVESFHQGAMLGVGDYNNHSGWAGRLMFRNNVFDGGEIGGSWGIQGVHIPKLVVTHNLFVNIRYHGVGARWGTGTVVQNNIFIDCGHQNYYADNDSTMAGGYNVVNRMPGTPLYSNPLDVVADPGLVNRHNFLGADGRPRTGDDGYRLRSSSPARDMGGGRTATRDMYQMGRPAGARPDAGPHEYR